MKNLWAVFAICLIFGSCQKPKAAIRTSFYYWLQANEYDSATAPLMQKLQVQKMYVHVMDVIWNTTQKSAMPTAKSSLTEQNPVTKVEVVPVVFVENTVLKQIDSTDIPALASNIQTTVRGFLQKIKSTDSTILELQIDCDWTPSTKDKYFELLKAIRAQNPKTLLGATIRLYPYKYPKAMGVPPVDYGVLMCYNLDQVKDAKTENSVLSTKVLKQYLGFGKYPLPLRPALPIFGWYAWFHAGKYQNIIYAPPVLGAGFKKLAGNELEVLADTVIAEKYLRRGDRLRNEFPTAQTLQEARKMILAELPKTEETIYYYWNENNIRYYEAAILP